MGDERGERRLYLELDQQVVRQVTERALTSAILQYCRNLMVALSSIFNVTSSSLIFATTPMMPAVGHAR